MGSFNATEASTKLTHCSHSSTRSCKNCCLSMRTDCSPIAPSVVMHKVEAVLDLYTHTRTHYPARISHLSLTRGGILQSVNLWGTHQGQPNFPRSPYPPYPPYVSSWSLMHAQRLCIADFLAGWSGITVRQSMLCLVSSVCLLSWSLETYIRISSHWPVSTSVMG